MNDDRRLTVRAEELGADLRELRLAAGMTLEAAGERIVASSSKISRLEAGKRGCSAEDVSALLAIYGCVGPKRAELLQLAREVDRRGWWQRDKPGFAQRQNTLTNLEAKAELIVSFEGMNVPGLLQTSEYTRALMVDSGLVPAAEVEDRMVARMLRHSVLLKAQPPRLLAIIDELVLHREVGGPGVLRRQLDYLGEAARLPHISLRVVPKTRAHAGSSGMFELIKRANGHRVVFLENLTSSLFLEEEAEIDTYETAIRALLAQASGAEESLRLLEEQAGHLEPGARTE